MVDCAGTKDPADGGVDAMAGDRMSRDGVVAAIRAALAQGRKVVVSIPGCVGEVQREMSDKGWFLVRTPKEVVTWPVYEDVPMCIEEHEDRLVVSWTGR